MSKTGVVWGVLIFYMIYLTFINLMGGFLNTPTLLNPGLNSESSVDTMIHFIKSFSLGNFQGVPDLLGIGLTAVWFIILAVMIYEVLNPFA